MGKYIKFNGERLKTARLYRGKTITELGEVTGISKQAISQFEKGKITPSLENLFKLMNELSFPRTYFYQIDDDVVIDTFFRSLVTTSKKEQLMQVVRTKSIAKVYSFLEKFIQFPDLEIENNISKNNIEDIANQLRNLWGLDNKPIQNLMGLLEKNGVVISTISTETLKIDAFTQIHKIHDVDRPFIVLGNEKESYVRRQFSLAHELGHIILHNHSVDVSELTKEEYRQMEDEANDFAAAFLLPKDSFTKDVIQYPNKLEFYVELKKKWRVSISAMIIRAFRLKIITHNQYQYLMKQISRNGWKIKEPLDDSLKLIKPVALSKAIDILLENNVMDEEELVQKLSEDGLALNSNDLESLLGLEEGKLTKSNKNSILLSLKE